MIAHGHPHQGTHGFPLTACGDDHKLIVGDTIALIDIHQHPIWNMQIPKFRGNVHYVHHATACNANPTLISLGCIDDLLNPVDVRGKRCHNNPLLSLPEDLIEGIAHCSLTHGEARPLCVGTI